jgi:hypothetical protein
MFWMKELFSPKRFASDPLIFLTEALFTTAETGFWLFALPPENNKKIVNTTTHAETPDDRREKKDI